MLSPTIEDPHRGRELGRVDRRRILETVDAPLAPLVDAALCQPAEADEHVDRADEPPLRQGSLRRMYDMLLQTAQPVPCHVREWIVAETRSRDQRSRAGNPGSHSDGGVHRRCRRPRRREAAAPRHLEPGQLETRADRARCLSSGGASRSRSRASASRRISVRARRESSSASRRTIERATELLPPRRSRSARAASASGAPTSHARRTAASAGSASPSSHRSGVMRRTCRAASTGSPSSSANETKLRHA